MQEESAAVQEVGSASDECLLAPPLQFPADGILELSLCHSGNAVRMGGSMHLCKHHTLLIKNYQNNWNVCVFLLQPTDICNNF